MRRRHHLQRRVSELPRHGACAFFVIFAAVSSTSAQVRAPDSTMCYVIAVGDIPEHSPFAYKSHQLPDTIVLQPDTVSGLGKQWSWRILSPQLSRFANSSPRFGPMWRMSAADSITVVWSNGFSGIRLKLQVRRDRVYGIAQAFTDVMESEDPDPTVPIRGARVPCPHE